MIPLSLSCRLKTQIQLFDFYILNNFDVLHASFVINIMNKYIIIITH